MDSETKAKIVVKKIIVDLSDRRGLGDEWENIDAVTKKEIRKIWIAIISEAMK